MDGNGNIMGIFYANMVCNHNYNYVEIFAHMHNGNMANEYLHMWEMNSSDGGGAKKFVVPRSVGAFISAISRTGFCW